MGRHWEFEKQISNGQTKWRVVSHDRAIKREMLARGVYLPLELTNIEKIRQFNRDQIKVEIINLESKWEDKN